MTELDCRQVDELEEWIMAHLKGYRLPIQGVVIGRLLGRFLHELAVEGWTQERKAQVRQDILETMIQSARAQVAVMDQGRE